MSGGSQYKFSVLAKIVKYMKTQHQQGDDHPLTLDEILDETNQLDVGPKVKQVINIFMIFLPILFFNIFSIFLAGFYFVILRDDLPVV